jgi:hypothetical protein
MKINKSRWQFHSQSLGVQNILQKIDFLTVKTLALHMPSDD